VRALLPVLQEDVDVHAWYARDWIESGGLRVNFVSSVDGAATAGGLSRGLQTAGDNAVFAALRDLADVVLVGASTAREEGYRGIELSQRRQGLRRDLGFGAHPPVAVISRSLALDPDGELFTRGTERTIVITAESGDAALRARLERVADVIVAGEDDVDLPAARAALVERGLTRILNEGGPSIFAELARSGVVDELCLSLTPLLAGPGSQRIVNGAPWPDGPASLSLAGVLEEDGALFLRYRSPGTMSSKAYVTGTSSCS
jgi:riboflavin biosynthesis pyrimidine reductase